MDLFEASLDTVESQRLTGASHDTESVPQFLIDLRLSDLYDIPGEYVAMTPEIFSAMRAGNKAFLEGMKSSETQMECFRSDKGDSILHLASSWGHVELVKSIVSECPSLLLEQNSKSRFPLHVAARGGHLAVVEALVASLKCFSAKLSDKEERERLNIYVLKDVNGDTPLHLALKDVHQKAELLTYQKRIKKSLTHRIIAGSYPDTLPCQMEIASCLVKANQRASFLSNKDGVSPLYMAIEVGKVHLVNAMLKFIGNNVQGKTSTLTSQLEGRKSLVHAALNAKSTYVLDVILNEDPDLVNERDEEGKTCLSVGASVGFHEGVCKLLDRSTSNVYECDADGSFSIHVAVEKGHIDIVKELLKRCPDSEYLLNKQGQNILHIAAKSGKAVDYVKKVTSNNHLMEEQDVNGNTPLHLATIYWRPRTLKKLTPFASKNPKVLNIKNKDGLTPFDIAELNLQSNYVFRERMTLVVLLCIYAPEDYSWMPLNGMTQRNRSEKHQSGGGNKYKDQINILLLVAALAATMTFAAGFTTPGGFNESGRAILAKDSNVSTFLAYDALAMQSSVVAIVALVWAQLGDPDIVNKALRVALPALYTALISMSFAFIFGVLATIKHNNVLYNWIYSTSIIFYFVVLFILMPYIMPQNSASTFLPILLWFVNEDEDVKLPTSGSGDTCVCVKRVESAESSSDE